MKRFLLFALVVLCLVWNAAFAATTGVTVAPNPSLLDWFAANKTVIFGAALALSELLAIIPAFKGNGILDTIIKALQMLSGKEQQ